jgi:hypothetical protein
MRRAVLNFILLACLVVLPELVPGQQISGPTFLPVIKSDTVKQVITFKQENVKPALNKYDYYNSLGIACKAELKLEKATKIPFRFRLGSLQQTDYLERKPNAQKPE